MSAVNQDKVEKSIGYTLQDVGGAFLALLVLTGNGFYRVIGWLYDEWRLNATIRGLSQLDDRSLDDIGIKRSSLDLRDDELMNLLRRRRAGMRASWYKLV
jgi:hypothetical protein